MPTVCQCEKERQNNDSWVNRVHSNSENSLSTLRAASGHKVLNQSQATSTSRLFPQRIFLRINRTIYLARSSRFEFMPVPRPSTPVT